MSGCNCTGYCHIHGHCPNVEDKITHYPDHLKFTGKNGRRIFTIDVGDMDNATTSKLLQDVVKRLQEAKIVPQ